MLTWQSGSPAKAHRFCCASRPIKMSGLLLESALTTTHRGGPPKAAPAPGASTRSRAWFETEPSPSRLQAAGAWECVLRSLADLTAQPPAAWPANHCRNRAPSPDKSPLALCARILPLHPYRSLPLLGKAGIVNDQDAMGGSCLGAHPLDPLAPEVFLLPWNGGEELLHRLHARAGDRVVIEVSCLVGSSVRGSVV